MSSLSDHVAFFLGTHGPSLTLETACSSSLVAIAMAVASLQQGDCDTALVTGLNYLNEKDFHLSLQVRACVRACTHVRRSCRVSRNGRRKHPTDQPNRPTTYAPTPPLPQPDDRRAV